MQHQIDEKEKERRIVTGTEIMEKNDTVAGHNLSWRIREHITHEMIDFVEF
jgi:hypothetical protein